MVVTSHLPVFLPRGVIAGERCISRNDIARHPQQPRERLLGQSTKPPPRNQKRLRDDVVDTLRRHPSPHVRVYRDVILAEDPLEPLSFPVGLIHIPYLPADSPALQSADEFPGHRLRPGCSYGRVAGWVATAPRA